MCDMYAWNGSDWTRITFDVNQPHPCLHAHDMAWNGQGLVVTGGYVDTSDTPSKSDWRFTFAPDGRSGLWSQVAIGTCQPIDGTSVTPTPTRPGATRWRGWRVASLPPGTTSCSR